MDTKQQHQAIDHIETYMESSHVSFHKIWTFINLALKEMHAH